MTKELCKTKAEVGMAGNGEPVTHLRHANLFGTLCQLNSGGQICPQAVRYFLLFFFFPSYNPSPSDPAGSRCSCHSVVITPLFSTVHVFQAGQVWRMKWQPGCELKWGDRRQGDRRNLLRIQCQHLAPGTWGRAAAGWGMAQLTARPDGRGGLSVLSLTLDWPWI